MKGRVRGRVRCRTGGVEEGRKGEWEGGRTGGVRGREEGRMGEREGGRKGG